MNNIVGRIQETFGYPASLVRLLAEHSEIRVLLNAPSSCIDAESVVKWHELGTAPCAYFPHPGHSTLQGWKLRDKHNYGSFTLHRPEYDQIGLCESTEQWTCDITDVHGFSASKSRLSDFTSTDEMVETNSSDLIDAITHDKLAKNLTHEEIRIIHSPGCDSFVRYLWDGRLFLRNKGGSHHFAAAKYIASRLSESVPLCGKLNTYSLNTLAIASLRRDFDMFVIPDETTISLGFHEAMKAFRATWLWHHLPHPFDNAKAILLPKNDERSVRVAALLRQADVTDLGQHLADLVSHQN
ncbi:MAG: DUF6685 family protein [Terracidiphilus sp.]